MSAIPFDLTAVLHQTWWESVLVAVIAVLLAVGAQLGLRLRTRGIARVLYGSELRAMVSVGLIALSAAVVCTIIRDQGPRVHDEFSYLVAADTFAHGRLTNPTHPMWRHFETMHVLMKPTMQSKYPPAQGLFLAAGQVLTGRAIAGVWVSFALACVALYWCVRAWMPRRWAFFGGLLPCLRFGTGLYYEDNHWTYWASTYWGGAVALLGGCLVLGTALRILRARAGARESLLLGVGLSILAASRPWEGLALAAPLFLLLTWRTVHDGGLQGLGRSLGPALAVTAVTIAGLGLYNWRVTGSPTTMPYQAYMQQYDVTPVLRFQPFRPEPVYGNEQMREYHLGFQVDIARTQLNGIGVGVEDVRGLTAFLLGRPLTGMVLLGVVFWRDRRLLLVLTLLAIGMASHGLTLVHPFWPHYFAPHVPLLVLLALRGMRVLYIGKFQSWRPGVYLGNAIVIATVGAFVCSAALAGQREDWDKYSANRKGVIRRLLEEPGDDLIVVRYGPRHFVHNGWVYNLSDIDAQPIVWARELGPELDAGLLDYYAERRVWLLEPDSRPLRLSPYQRTATVAAP